MADIFSNCQKIYKPDKPQFLSLLQKHIALDKIVPASFRKYVYASTNRSRKYLSFAILWALIIHKIFSIPIDSLPQIFLHCSAHLREFYEFDKVPDASKITLFKQDTCSFMLFYYRQSCYSADIHQRPFAIPVDMASSLTPPKLSIISLLTIQFFRKFTQTSLSKKSRLHEINNSVVLNTILFVIP